MGKCIIFCAGEFDGLAEPIRQEDCVIAADGGLAHLQALGVEPDIVLGDFDSLGYIPTQGEVHPVEKDDTDAMLAVRRGLALGYREFVLYGSLDGPRLDHTVANFQTLEFLCRRGSWGYLVGRNQIVTAVREGGLVFSGAPEGTVSVFCMGADASGVTLRGLYYPLKNGTLTAGFPLGVSNHFQKKPASVSVSRGSLLVLWDRRAGFPERGV